MSLDQLVKTSLTRVGALMTTRSMHRLNAAINYMEVGRWMNANSYLPKTRVQRRELLFDQVGKRIENLKVLYLEFGVWKGASIRHWARLLTNPASQLHGFDSFEGLPEDFNLVLQKGGLSTEGRIPQLDDSRVRFVKGWFEDTLPNYRPPEYDQLVVNIDCDLYSSTRFVLDTLEPLISDGTYLYFDDFSDRSHELRAFQEFRNRTGMHFEVIGATHELSNVMFQRVA